MRVARSGRTAAALVAVMLVAGGGTVGWVVRDAQVAGATPVSPPVFVTGAPTVSPATNPPTEKESLIDSGTNTVGPVFGPYVTEGSFKAEISPDGSKVYLPQLLDGAVMIVNGTTGAFIRTVTGLGCPDSLAFSPDGSHVYVGNGCFSEHTMHVIDTATDTASSTISAACTPPTPPNNTFHCSPTDPTITPDGLHGYISNTGEGTVSAFNTSTNTIGTTVAVGSGPGASAITPDGSKLYVTNDGSGTVSVITTSNNVVSTTITVEANPQGVAITPDGKFAYVVNDHRLDPTGTVSVINTATDMVVATVAVGSRPTSVTVTPDGTQAYVSHFDDSNVWVIDTASNTVVHKVAVGGGQGGATAYPDQAPVAALSVTVAPVGQATSFDASASTVKYGTITSYAWDFGDSTTAVTSTPTTTHTYAHNGPFTASVTETDSVGTSTTRVFTGQTLSLSGGPQAKATSSFSVPDATTTALTASVDPVAVNKPVTYTATVTPANVSSGTPVGNVTFKDGVSPIGGCAPIALSGGAAGCTVTYSSAGSHTITAAYAGTPSFLPSTSPPLGETVTTCASLAGCNLANANLMNAKLAGAKLGGASLSGANLSGADLSGAELRGASLSGANLSGADLSGADLRAASLSGANLTGANLTGANLRGVDLSGANLTNATMTGANLAGAGLSGITWSNTTCPDGTNSNAHGFTCLGHL